MADDVYDLTIIGAGPTGLYAASYAGLRQMRTKVIEALPELGGQLNALYPEKEILDVAGFPLIQAKELVSALATQALRYHPTVCLAEQVVDLSVPEDPTSPTRLRSTLGEHLTRAVLVTGGVGAFAPRTLDRPGVAELDGHGVGYFVRDLGAFRGQRVLIVGGGDSAIDWALALQPICAKVILVHRRGEFRAHEGAVREIIEAGVEVRLYQELNQVFGNGQGSVGSAEICSNRDNFCERLEVDSVILSLGFKADLGPINAWGLEMDKGGIVVDGFMRTNVRGVYAAGDIAAYPGKLRLITTGFAEAAMAVNWAKAEIDPSAKAFPGHSTERTPAA